MNIGIDVSSLVYGTGVSHYTSNLIRGLVRLYPNEQFKLFGGSLRQWHHLKQAVNQLNNPGGSNILPLPPKMQSILFNRLHAPIDWFLQGVDVFHSWDWYVPNTTKAALVTTIHDLSAIKYPQQTHPEIVLHHQKTLQWIKHHANVIIAVSQATKQDIIQVLDVDPGKIEVIYEALPQEQEITPTASSLKSFQNKHQITKPYFLIVASQEPRKNINRMIEAFEPFSKEFELVIVGKSGFDDIPNKPFIIKTGYLSSIDLAAAYHQAEGLLYCSISEGFGLPILEAFYHRVPVITSNVSSMPEIAGQAVSYANPLDTQSITSAIHDAIKNKQTLIKAGQKQLSKFSWDQVAKQTMEAYRHAYISE